MKGVLSGSLWGLVLGGAGLSFASLVSEQPKFAEGPPAPQLSVPALDVATVDQAVALHSTTDETPVVVPAARLDVSPGLTGTAPQVSTEPAALPKTADVTAGIEAPVAVTTTGFAIVSDAPNASRVETTLAAPSAEEIAPSVDTAPAAAALAPVIEEAPVELTTTENSEKGETAPLIVIEAPQEEVLEEAAPEVVEEDAAPDSDLPEAETEVVAGNQAPEPEVNAGVEPNPSVPEETAVIVAPAPAEEEQAVVVTEVLPQTTTAVRINRPIEAETGPELEASEAPDDVRIPDDAPALLRFAVPFEAPEGAALIAIVLVDDGQMSDAPSAVADLGFVPTVAVNALSSASRELAANYSTAGVEVAMQAKLPDGAQPTDVEVAFEAARGLVPEVAMLFSDGTGAMQDRAVTSQVMQVLASDGYGFVAVQRGLSNAARAAEQADVPAAIILRDIDGAGEDARAIARALDQAAFRARQSGSAVLLGRVTPDTLMALKSWAAELDQDTLAIAPVSAILLRAN